ncbi:MAG: hypothetical protein JEZ00_08055 [Anaerolineaceae bacterium]|nr:hypothetical protein [Anaerolineaceae bacterium]
MTARRFFSLGAALLVIGLLILFVRFSGENLVMVLMPYGLVGLGLLFLVSPNLIPSNADHTVQFIGEYRQNYFQESIPVKTIFMGVGDVELDFSQLDLPLGDSALKIVCFAAGIQLKFDQDSAYRIQSNAFVSEVRENELKQEFIVAPYEKNSLHYEGSDRRLNIEIHSFISDISIS